MIFVPGPERKLVGIIQRFPAKWVWVNRRKWRQELPPPETNGAGCFGSKKALVVVRAWPPSGGFCGINWYLIVKFVRTSISLAISQVANCRAQPANLFR
jgi:hypothetical protein